MALATLSAGYASGHLGSEIERSLGRELSRHRVQAGSCEETFGCTLALLAIGGTLAVHGWLLRPAASWVDPLESIVFGIAGLALVVAGLGLLLTWWRDCSLDIRGHAGGIAVLRSGHCTMIPWHEIASARVVGRRTLKDGRFVREREQLLLALRDGSRLALGGDVPLEGFEELLAQVRGAVHVSLC